MADSPHQLALLRGLATAESLSPFAQQLQALQQLSEACTARYSSEPPGMTMPNEFASQQLVEAHCAATSNALQQMTPLLQQWCASSSTNTGSSGSISTTATASAPTSAGPRSSNTVDQLPVQQLSQDALQALLLLTGSTGHTIDAMRKVINMKAGGGLFALMTGAASADAPSLQDLVGGIASTGESGKGQPNCVYVCVQQASLSTPANYDDASGSMLRTASALASFLHLLVSTCVPPLLRIGLHASIFWVQRRGIVTLSQPHLITGVGGTSCSIHQIFGLMSAH